MIQQILALENQHKWTITISLGSLVMVEEQARPDHYYGQFEFSPVHCTVGWVIGRAFGP